MKITLVTDTWLPSINGVVTTLTNTVRVLESWGHQVQVIEPSQFRTIGLPGYTEVRLSWNVWHVGRMIENFNPDAIHIATEGPLGLAARWYCKVEKRSIPHNTSYHTKFPEYLYHMARIPEDWTYWCMRIFHKFSTRVLVTNEDMKRELEAKGFQNLAVWNRGVDRKLYSTKLRTNKINLRPILLCVSRASIEKGLDDFCNLPQMNGVKILVGDGPYLEELKRKYPDVQYMGFKQGRELAEYYAMADVFVFPSKSDTFGVVMLEAMSCGTPIAAYPVTGPLDVVINGVNGHMHDNLLTAVDLALRCDRKKVRRAAKPYSWESCTKTFLENLIIIHSDH